VSAVAQEVAPDLYEDLVREQALRELRWRMAERHPAFFLQFVQCIDAKTGEEFKFDLLTEEERALVGLEGPPGDWHWHREILDSWLEQEVSLEYKARQIGITWLAGGYGLWLSQMRPGTRFLIISINLEEATKVISRIWGMHTTTPSYMKRLILTKPSRGGEPSQEIEWIDGQGRKSGILALPSTPKAGHGETAALVLLDEFARQDYARESWKAAFPIIDGGGKAILVSTANGVSTEDTEGEAQGNFFHYLWQNAETMKIDRRFHSVFTHPHRDERWYTENAVRLPASDRAEQYPRTPEEGFQGTGRCWFDLDKLNAYRERWKKEKRVHLYKFSFREALRKASFVYGKFGDWTVYVEPEEGRKYAISADPATGSGDDFSAAHVIDLHTGGWVAEYHAKVGEDVFAKDLYYMGRWYNDALIAVEKQGGYGRATIIALRDGIKGRKPYTKLYRHHIGPEETTDPADRDDYGYPVTSATRPLLVNQLESWIREELCPWISPDLDGELRTFSKRPTRPSPRALEGCNDDRVMSAAGSLEIYRQYGHHERKRKPRPVRSRWKNALYPWEVK
jgi:hypothetical protein